MSADSVVTTSDQEVGEASDVPALDPGESASRIATFAVSASASPGTVMWVGECVDPVEGESDVDNNCSAALKVTVVGSPDLVASVSPDSVTVAPGGSFEYAAAVRNQGNVAAPATRVRTFVSADSVVTTSDDEVGEASGVPALGPGESASRAATFAVSASLAPGTVVWVGECVDPVEGESDVDNNCSTAIKVAVTGSPDLVASVSPDSVAVAPGGSFEYAAAVRNQGTAAAPATRVRTFMSADSVVTTSDQEVGEASDVPALDPGESASRIATFAVSASASPGTVMWVGECVDPVEGESDVDNNCSAALKVTVVGSPDLVASVSPDSVTVAPGGSFEYAAAVRNQGNVAAPATRVRTFVSADSVVTTSDDEVGEASDVPALGPGESASRAATFAVSASLAPGTVVWVGECVDPVEGESDVDNNCSTAIKVAVTGSPDLVASVSPDSVAVAPGGSFEYAAAVRNQGNVAAPATRVRTFVSADSVVTTSDDEVGEASGVPALGPGESASRAATFAVSASLAPGTVVWVGECVDPVEGESDVDNNCSTAIKVAVTGSPDLVASVSPDSVAVAPGGNFEYVVEIRNRGDAAAPATRVRTFASADSVVTTSDEMVGGTSLVPALGPGESVQGTASMTVSSSAPPGTVVWLGECVDPVEGESDVDNNCSTALKLAISATGGLRAAGAPVARRPRGPDSGAPSVFAGAVVRPDGQIQFGPVARSSRPSPAGACQPSSPPRSSASSQPALCRSAGEFALVAKRPPR